MGWFGSSSSSNNNKSKNAPNGDAIYVDMEANAGLPIAIAIPEAPPQYDATATVTPSAPPMPPSPPSSPPSSTMAPPPPEKHLQPMSKQQALQMARVHPAGVATMQQTIFVSRTPTVLPYCPCCSSRNVRTRTRTAPSFLTWVAVVALAFVFWPLCWIPLVTDTCRQTFHYCSNCNAEVGSIRPFQDCCVKNR